MSRLRALRLLPLLLAAVVAGGAAGAVEARPVATAPNDAAMEKLERIVRARVESRRTTGIVAGMVFPDGETPRVRLTGLFIMLRCVSCR